MKDVIDDRTMVGLRHYGDDATKRYYEWLRNGEFKSTHCTSCDETVYPPREFCPFCHGRDIEWVDLPREGTLYAFTTQGRSFRLMSPDVIGLVELEGVGKILTHIRGELATMRIGQRVAFEPHEISDELVVPRFHGV
jgi:uncharacterized OB-fold protein